MARNTNRSIARRLVIVASILLTATISVGQPISTMAPVRAWASAATFAPNANSPFGVAGVMRWPTLGTMGQPAQAMLDTGGSWVREDFPWHVIERVEGQYNWTNTDSVVEALKEKKLNILGILGYSVDWATETTADDGGEVESLYPPNVAKFERYVRAVVSKYKGDIHFWEVWNEPNNGKHWLPAPRARDYAEMLKVVYRAIKQSDPTATVLSGGVNGNAMPFLEELVAHGALDSFDILSIHCYAEPVAGSANPRTEARPEVHKMVEIELAKYRAFLQRHNRGDRRIWVTEMGWPARNWQMDDVLQAEYLAQAYAQMLSYGVAERVFWYSFKDDGSQPDGSYGLIAWGNGKTDLGPRRAAFDAYKVSAAMLADATPAGRIQLAPFATVEGFEQPGEWTRRPPMEINGTFVIAPEQKHTGKSSGRLMYDFTGTKQFIDFAPPQNRPLLGRPTRLGLWVLGDATGNYLSAWLKDKDGELFKVRLGAMRASTDGWRYYESRINNYYFPGETYANTAGRAANGVPDYPLSFDAFRLENDPDGAASRGTIYIDDLQSFDGPDVTIVRFNRADKTVVDVLWSVVNAQVNLPTGSSAAQVTERNGANRSVAASNGALSLSISHSPIYVVHKPSTAQQPTPTAMPEPATPIPPSPMPPATVTPGLPNSPEACKAYAPAQAASYPDNRYFPETKHNLHGAFRRYWEWNGAVAIFGYPITEEFVAVSTDGKPYVQQYFQRARMEYHPENAPPHDIQLGLMGVSSTVGRSFPPATITQSGGSTTYFPETQHSIRLFRDWWLRNGGLAVFGFPISEEMQEVSPTDGKTYTVQYFQRNRLEYHPQYAGTNNEVLLGLLGAEWLKQQGCR